MKKTFRAILEKASSVSILFLQYCKAEALNCFILMHQTIWKNQIQCIWFDPLSQIQAEQLIETRSEEDLVEMEWKLKMKRPNNIRKHHNKNEDNSVQLKANKRKQLKRSLFFLRLSCLFQYQTNAWQAVIYSWLYTRWLN